MTSYGQSTIDRIPDEPLRDRQTMSCLLNVATSNPLGGLDLSKNGNDHSSHTQATLPIEYEFKSAYKDLDSAARASWAYDLHQFLLKRGTGWENYQKRKAEFGRQHSTSAFEENATSDADEKYSHVPINELRDFAKEYWQQHSLRFRHKPMASVFRYCWVNDSILDAFRIYMDYQRSVEVHDSTDFVNYKDATLNWLVEQIK